MKRLSVIKLNILILMLAFSAGIIFFTCAFFNKLPKSVTVNGIDVSGKSRVQAAETVRESIKSDLKNKSLTVHGNRGEYVFTYPEISWRDNLQSLLKTINKEGEYTADISYYLNGISEVTAHICNEESLPVVEPYALFNEEGEPFTYFEGSDGLKANRTKLLSDIRASLEGGFESVTVSTRKIARTTSMNTVRYNTRLLSSFTTYFDGGNFARVHNIALAAEKINGTILENGESFSFNQTVGERTEERGFQPAKIIERGEFVEGIGGGVCQVSTTLFNCALLAGCDITEFHPHSLAVSYVPPSFDAMVSGTYFDLKFVNLTGYTLYLRACVGENYISFKIYGRGNGAHYGYSSVVTGNITAPEEITTDCNLVKEGRDGIISEGYLTIRRGGLITTRLFRRDKYAPIKRVVLDTPPQEENPSPTESEELEPEIQ